LHYLIILLATYSRIHFRLIYVEPRFVTQRIVSFQFHYLEGDSDFKGNVGGLLPNSFWYDVLLMPSRA